MRIKSCERKYICSKRVVILDQSLKSNIVLSNPFIKFDEKKYRDAVNKSGLKRL